MLTGQEGKHFHALAYTKTFILLVDAILMVTLAPVLISFFMKGKFRDERKNPITRLLEKIYEPIARTYELAQLTHYLMEIRRTKLIASQRQGKFSNG